jgi:putative ABC transport system permease protein
MQSRLLSGLSHDLRIAFRSLGATPTVTIATVLCLALAIGANTAIFSIVNSLLLRTLPVRDASRLVYLTDSVPTEAGDTRIRAWSHPAWEQIRRRPLLFESATAMSLTRFNVSSGGETQWIEGLIADASLFDTLGVSAVAGRTFTARDDRRDGGPDGPVAVISHAYWQRQFGGEASAMGRTIRLNGVAYSIVGVTPASFFGLEVGRTFDVIVPLQTLALLRGVDSPLDSAASNFLTMVARLKPHQSIEDAATALRREQPAIRAATVGPWDEAVRRRYFSEPFTVLPAEMGSSTLRDGFRNPLRVLMAVVAVVLLIGCANVANLLLARALARRHQFSVQVALGASRWRLVRQLFAEASLLSVAGAVLGVVMAFSGSQFLVGQLSTPNLPVFLELSIDARVLAFTVAVAALTTLLFATAPAFRAASVAPIDALRDRTRGSGRKGDLMGWLIPVQVALSLVLLVAAGVFVRSFASLATHPLGYEPDKVLTVTMITERIVEPAQRVALFERVLDAVRRQPEVEAAAVSFQTPASSGGLTPAIEVASDEGPRRVEPNQDVFGNLISPGWFGTLGMRLLAGRDIAAQDRRGAPGVAVVNESFVGRFLDGANPIGRTLTVYAGTPRAIPLEIVGVAADTVFFSPRSPVRPMWFMPIAQFPNGALFDAARLSVRPKIDRPARIAGVVATAVAAVEPRLPLTSRVLDDQLGATLVRDRLMAQLAGFFGVLALMLAAIGLYGVSGYALAQRRHEVGVRLALGATPRGIIRMLLVRLSARVGFGIAAGAALSAWAWSFVQGLTFGVPTRDALTISAAALILAATAALAAWLPARRAKQLSPVELLRME